VLIFPPKVLYLVFRVILRISKFGLRYSLPMSAKCTIFSKIFTIFANFKRQYLAYLWPYRFLVAFIRFLFSCRIFMFPGSLTPSVPPLPTFPLPSFLHLLTLPSPSPCGMWVMSQSLTVYLSIQFTTWPAAWSLRLAATASAAAPGSKEAPLLFFLKHNQPANK